MLGEYYATGWWVLYLNHRNHADVTREDDFDFLKRFKGYTYVAEGTCGDMEAMAKLLNCQGTNFYNYGGLTNVS